MSQLISAACHRPYLIVAAFPKAVPRIIACTYDKTDAEDHVRFLQRRIPGGKFYVVFDPEPVNDKKANE